MRTKDDSPLVPVSNPPLGHKLARHLRREILTGELRQDSHLVESSLAELYGVSRGPVRDALKQLERDGLVYPARQGYRVAALTAADIREIYSIRFMIERSGIENTVGTDEPWQELEQIVEAMRSAAQRGDQSQYTRLDLAFHRTFCEVGGGKRLKAIWELFEPTLTTLFELNPHPAQTLVDHAEEHAQILASLQEGTSDWLPILENHLHRAQERFLKDLASETVSPAAL